ncbi:MAG: hypothetical protein AAF676_14535 [Pseudomonadota bacterium]
MSDAGPFQAIIRVRSGPLVRARFLGQGPPVLLLHESPRSSAALLPLAERLAGRFAFVMLDTPGYGLSDPMPLSRPEIPDFAAVALEAAEAIGLPPGPVYGTHTGAAVAAAAADLAPERATAAILDGYAVFTPEEQAELLASYLPPFRPTLDGTHVAWLWARVRDQFAAFPWNRVSDAARLPFGPPPIEVLNSVVQDFLLAGDQYRVGYAAAFRYDHLAPLRRSRAPMRVACREDDLLLPHLERCRGVGERATLHRLSADRDVWAAALGDLFAEASSAPPTTARALRQAARAAEGARRIADTSAGPVVTRFDGPEDAPKVVLLHDAPGGMADLDGLAERLARGPLGPRRVVRINLPGLAVSPLAPGVERSVEAMARGAAEALAEAGAQDAPVVAHGAALALALALEGRAPGPLVTLDPWTLAAEARGLADALPDLEPRWDGAHLNAAFWWARDHELFKPWSNRSNLAARSLGPERDAERIHARFRAIVMGGAAGVDLIRALYREDPSAGLAARRGRAVALLHGSDPDFDALRSRAGEALGEGAVRSAPREPWGLAEAVAAALREVEA